MREISRKFVLRTLEYPRKQPIALSRCHRISGNRARTWASVSAIHARIYRLVIRVIAFPLSSWTYKNGRPVRFERDWGASVEADSKGIFHVSLPIVRRTFLAAFSTARYETLFSLFIFLPCFHRRRYYYSRDHSSVCTSAEGTLRANEKLPFSISLILMAILTQRVI